MNAVIFHGPHKIALEKRPVPNLNDPTDVILRVEYTALCGSELHVYRGHQKSPTGFIMGHEFTGTVVKVGSAISNFKVGDKVVCPFTTSCGDKCFYCRRGQSSRCTQSLLFGSQLLDGGQAEYVRIPLADSTLVKLPLQVIKQKYPNYTDQELQKQSLKFVLMADIFPTGFFAATNALKDFNPDVSQIDGPPVIAIVGCGPVGLCGVISAIHLAPKGTLVYAIDTVPDRLQEAAKLGATPILLDSVIDKTDPAHPINVIKKATNNRGADAVMEIVGHSDALRLAFDLIRPWGRISSVGVHNAEIPITGNECYNKNVSLQFGRCPVRSIFDQALKAFVDNLDKLDILTGHIMKLQDAEEAYPLFDQRKVQKVVFEI